ncbi:MAG TPA: hypothetical protein VFX16_37825 [Pseudonocardiaceae bacterium]|nr:hypothetical protein [Pseudonocardiaceae bacterium]
MSGRPSAGRDSADLEKSLRGIEAAVAELGETVSRLHDRVVGGGDWRRTCADRVEAVVREVLEARSTGTSDSPSCDR